MPGRQERRCAMQLIWKDNYNVGISLIDDQHRKLVDIINHLGFISSIGIGLPSLSGAIKELQNYAAIHFRTEEELMTQSIFPEIEEHKNKHIEFLETVHRYEKMLANGDFVFSSSVLNFLLDWLFDHILNVDRELAGFLKKSDRHIFN
jgi:hemerythrin-like metal-binding protein